MCWVGGWACVHGLVCSGGGCMGGVRGAGLVSARAAGVRSQGLRRWRGGVPQWPAQRIEWLPYVFADRSRVAPYPPKLKP